MDDRCCSFSATQRMGIGQAQPRLEDAALLTGLGQFIDDVDLQRQAYAGFLRSPYAHARIVSIDSVTAKTAPGVLGVYVAADLEGTVDTLHESVAARAREGTSLANPPRPVLAVERVRHVGDTVAMVLARDAATARDALELIDVEYDELPAVTDPMQALDGGVPPIWEQAPGNVALHWEGGDREATARAFESAHHVTRLELVANRVIAMCMETRGVVAAYDQRSGRYVLYTPSQGVNRIKSSVAQALKVPESQVQVITPDVGGAFGIKIAAYPEHVLVAWAARELARPVKWCADRADSFVTDGQCRDHVMQGELALDENGRFLALRCETVSNIGAYASAAAFAIPTVGGTRCLTGVYAIPTFYTQARVVFSNTVPVVAYRGAGKPEFNYVVERLVDAAARELDLDAAELRRVNVVPPAAMPYRTPTGLTFDSGEFAKSMDKALEIADRDGFAARRAEANVRERLRGFGFALFQEPDGPLHNRVSFTADSAANVTLTVTAQSGGQGHVTTLTQIVCERLGLPPGRVHIVQGDSDRVGPGDGTGGSAFVTITGTALVRVIDEVVDKGRHIAAHLLQARVADIGFERGVFRVAQKDAALSFEEVATAAFDPSALPQGLELGLNAISHYKSPAYSYPSGCHVCEVEIDPETGAISIEAYTAVDDHGVIINPMLLEGQLLGGIAQGIGQALLEHCVYDRQSGQLLSGNLTDYCIPRADDVPALSFQSNATPCTTNPLGVKGVGESGCTGALPAVMNAVVDALSVHGVRHIDMPATAEKVWSLCVSRFRESLC